MGISRTTDHGDQAVDLLLEQYKNKPRLEALLRAYVSEVQAFEDAAWDVLILRLIDNASAEQLNVIGRIVGESRGNHIDALYRLFIAVRIRINRSQGHASDVLEVLFMLTEGSPAEARRFYEVWPANMLIEFTYPLDLPDPQEVFDRLFDTKAGGVGLIMITPTQDEAAQFWWSDVDEVSIASHGYGDVDTPDYFGLLSAVYQ